MGTRLVVPWEQRIRFGLSDKHERAFENRRNHNLLWVGDHLE